MQDFMLKNWSLRMMLMLTFCLRGSIVVTADVLLFEIIKDWKANA
jgi:hypothetical protein